MLVGSISDYMAQQFAGNPPLILPWSGASIISGDKSDSEGEDDGDGDMGPVSGPRTKTNVWLASQHCMF